MDEKNIGRKIQVRLDPRGVEDEQVFGKLKGIVNFRNDITDSIEEDWDVNL